jgi:hypothetical protein
VLSSHSLPYPGANSGKSRRAEFPFSWLRSGFGIFRESGWREGAEDLIQLPLQFQNPFLEVGRFS